jgi:hypothetical protein
MDDILGSVTGTDSVFTAPPAPPATPTPVEPPAASQPPAEDWSKRYAGLQQAIQKRLQASGWQNLDAIPAKADLDRLSASAGELADLRVQFEQISLQAQALASEREQLSTRLAAVEGEGRKVNLILQNAPTLVSFADYIPTRATPEEQLAEIETFRTRLGTVAPAASSAARPPTMPSTAPPMAGGSPPSSELFKQMSTALQAKNWGEYERLADLWHTASTNPD